MRENAPKEFIEYLKKDINELREDLLGKYYEKANNKEEPDPFMGVEQPKDIKLLKNRVRAFYLVSHAEIQSYLEYICDYHLKYAYKKYTEKGEISKLLLFFLSTYSQGFIQPSYYNVDPNRAENSNKKLHDTDSIEKRYEYIKKEYNKTIEENNGVKKKNLYLLLHPLGITVNSFEELKMTSLLDEFGKQRGEFAHTALHRTVFKTVPGSQIIDIDIIYKTIDEITTSIEFELLPLLNSLVEQ
ncbi:hypothetical protein [Planomicrobium okeanokoites]|uniref:hypothetical protein n=1 Tax=Planomicrobium okeanokoites TaxID=244 RepID=UPI002493C33B|nr:hypothetical protein [Planomicrobium okeanokoites]